MGLLVFFKNIFILFYLLGNSAAVESFATGVLACDVVRGLMSFRFIFSYLCYYWLQVLVRGFLSCFWWSNDAAEMWS